MPAQQRVTQVAGYVVQQLDGNSLVLDEFYDATVDESVIIARAAELEAANPLLTTLWYSRGAVSETLILPGTVQELNFPVDAQFLDVTGATAVRASINGSDLPTMFYRESSVLGEVVQFFDNNDELIAEATL